MSFSDPVKIIDHIPQDFDMKIKQRHRGQIKPAPKIKAQPAKALEPFSMRAARTHLDAHHFLRCASRHRWCAHHWSME